MTLQHHRLATLFSQRTAFAVTLLLAAQNAMAAPWLSVGNLYVDKGGYFGFQYQTAISETTTNSGAPGPTSVSSHTALSTQYGVGLQNEMRGYMGNPYLSQFTLVSKLDTSLENFHAPEDGALAADASVSATLRLYPNSRYEGQLNTAISQQVRVDATDSESTTSAPWFEYRQQYIPTSHDGKYGAVYKRSETEQTFAASGDQALGRNTLKENFSHQKVESTGATSQNEQSQLYVKHGFTPVYTGVVIQSVVSAVDVAPAPGTPFGPQPVVINTSMAYMYDKEYVDIKTMPRISGGISVVLDRADILENQLSANVSVGWPVWKQLVMGTQLNVSSYGAATNTGLSHNVRRGFKSKVAGQIRYDRYLSGALQQQWSSDRTDSLTWTMGGGHSIRYPAVYELFQPISIGITQDANLSGDLNNVLTSASLAHTVTMATTAQDIRISTTLSDNRSYDAIEHTSVAVQNAQLSLSKPIIKETYIESDAKFNVQWQEIQSAYTHSSLSWATLQYSYNNRRIAGQRNLSGNYAIIGRLDDSGTDLRGSGAINYHIGAVQVGGKASASILNTKFMSAQLDVKRYF